MKKLYVAIFIILLCAGFVQAQYTPDSGSAERKAILDALRTAVKRELKKPLIFSVGSLRVKDGWAVISATPLQPDGRAFNYSGTKYDRSWRSGDFEDGVQALLRKRGNSWQVVKSGLNATDYWVGYACSKARGCPKALQ